MISTTKFLFDEHTVIFVSTFKYSTHTVTVYGNNPEPSSSVDLRCKMSVSNRNTDISRIVNVKQFILQNSTDDVIGSLQQHFKFYPSIPDHSTLNKSPGFYRYAFKPF